MFKRIAKSISESVDRHKETKVVKKTHQDNYGVWIEDFLKQVGDKTFEKYGLNYHVGRTLEVKLSECAWYLYFGSKATRSVTIALLETASLGLAVMESEEYNPDYSKSKSMSEQASAAADSNIIQAFIVDDRLYFNTVSDCHELQLSKDSLFSLLDDFSNHINKKLFSFTDINLPNFEQESPVGLLKEYIRASFGTIQCRE